MKRKLVSICVPVYNESLNIKPLYERLAKFAEHMSDRYTFEFLFTDNHSEDDTFETVSRFIKLRPKNPGY